MVIKHIVVIFASFCWFCWIPEKWSYLLFSNIYSTAPWFLNAPGLTSLHLFCKSSAFPEIFCVEYYEICDQYQDVCKLYTCGSLSQWVVMY